MTSSLPEDLHPIEFAPTKNQANSNGEVMFYAEGYGWYSGHFSRPHMPSTTHWTLLPDRPPTTLSNKASQLDLKLKQTKWLAPYQFLKVKMYAQQRMDSLAFLLLDSIIYIRQNENIRDRAKNIIEELKKNKQFESTMLYKLIIKPYNKIIRFICKLIYNFGSFLIAKVYKLERKLII